MKVLTFDNEVIRSYMMGSDVLKQGIKYFKYIKPELSDLAAQESAISFAQIKCQEYWRYYEYIYTEWDAFQRFSEKVNRHELFDTREYDKKIEAEKRNAELEKKYAKNETKRRNELAIYCQRNHLSFEEENRKQLIELYKKNRIGVILSSLGAIGLFLAIVGGILFLFVAEWFIPNSENLLIPFLVTVGVLIVLSIIFLVASCLFSVRLPERVISEGKKEYEKMKNGK